MEKLDFCKERSLNDSISFCFAFVKQEFKPLLKAFGLLVCPVLLVDMIMKGVLARNLADVMRADSEMPFMNVFASSAYSYLVAFVGFWWLALFVLSYVRVYMERREAGAEGKILPAEVWRVMCGRMGWMFVWGVLYLLIICVGLIFFLVPGFYFAVALLPGCCFVVLRRRNAYASLEDAMKLVKGEWWNFFGYLFVLQLLVGVLAYLFTIPYMVMNFTSIFVGEVPGVYETAFGLMFSTLGQYVMSVVTVVGIAVKWYGMVEKREHSRLFRRIEELGTTEECEEVR